MKIKSLLTTIFFTALLFSNSTFSKNSIDSLTQNNLERPILAYFGYGSTYCGCPNSKNVVSYSLTPIHDGYYRVLIGRNTEGHYLVQDFYQNSHKPLSSAFWVVDPKYLFSLDIYDVDGEITIYRKDESKAEFNRIKDHRILFHESFDQNGLKRLQYELDKNNQYQTTIWYETGKKAAEFILSLIHI